MDTDADIESGQTGDRPERQQEFEQLADELEGNSHYPDREREGVDRNVNKPQREYGETADREEDRAPDSELPISDYQQLTVPEVMKRAKNLTADDLAEVLRFERSHRNRKTLVAQLTRLAAQPN